MRGEIRRWFGKRDLPAQILRPGLLVVRSEVRDAPDSE